MTKLQELQELTEDILQVINNKELRNHEKIALIKFFTEAVK